MKRFFIPLLLTSIATAETAEDFRFKYEVLATDLPQPMTMQAAPDGRIFFNEIAGKVRLLDPATKKITEIGALEVTNNQENGLLGMALDPGFATNGWIYLLHSPKNFDGQFISRFTIKDDKLLLETRRDLISWKEQRRECCHHAGCLRFGPDGNLYASTGDNTNPFGSDGFSPTDERPDREPWDAQKSAANTNDLRGKILRIRPTADGGYTIPEGNLFKPGTPDTRPEIYAMGFRNPWRFNIDSKTGIVYAGDVGPDSGRNKEDRGPNGFDTINQIRRPAHFGWPYSRGGKIYNRYDFTNKTTGEKFDPLKPANLSPNNTGLKELPPVTAPLIWYPGSKSNEFPLLGSGGRTACAGPVFHFDPPFEKTGGFPDQFDGCLLFYDWARPFINWARLDKDSNLTGLEPFTASARVALGRADGSERFQIKRPVDVFFGKDGCLYLADYGETWGANKDSRIVKISYQRGNVAPIAKASGTSTAGKEPLVVQLSAKGSQDPEGKPLKYEWRIQPGDTVVSLASEGSITLKERGNFIAELKVIDEQGASSSATLPLSVGNTPPVVKFIAPQDGDFFTPGEPLSYNVEISDAEDGDSKEGAKAAQMAAMTLVSAEWQGADGKNAEAMPGLTLMKQSDCFNCHSIDQKLLGPPLVEIAKKYKSNLGALEDSVKRVQGGSTGVWGQVPMLPHPQHTADEIHMMVSWIFSLDQGNNGPALNRGLSGRITVPKDEKIRSGTLEASFTDLGSPPANPLSGKAVVKLRSRTLEAESADEIKGPRIVGSGVASGKNSIGATAHGHTLRFSNLNLTGSSSITARASSGGAGGKVEIRANKPDGELLAEFEAKPSGNWEEYHEITVPLKIPAPRSEIFVVFINPGKTGLMNLDWLRFNR